MFSATIKCTLSSVMSTSSTGMHHHQPHHYASVKIKESFCSYTINPWIGKQAVYVKVINWVNCSLAFVTQDNVYILYWSRVQASLVGSGVYYIFWIHSNQTNLHSKCVICTIICWACMFLQVFFVPSFIHEYLLNLYFRFLFMMHYSFLFFSLFLYKCSLLSVLELFNTHMLESNYITRTTAEQDCLVLTWTVTIVSASVSRSQWWL